MRKTTKRRKRGMGSLTASASTGQKLGHVGLVVLSGVAGAAAGAFAGKYSGLAGLAFAGVSPFIAKGKFMEHLSAAGIGMIAVSPRMASSAQTTGGVDGLADFASEGKQRLKAFAGDLSEKTWTEKWVKPKLGLEGMGNYDDGSYTAMLYGMMQNQLPPLSGLAEAPSTDLLYGLAGLSGQNKATLAY